MLPIKKVNSNLRAVHIRQLRAQRDACITLFAYYRDRYCKPIIICPLCEETSSEEKCASCPWFWFEDMPCNNYAIPHFDVTISDVRRKEKGTGRARASRIIMLRAWIRRMDAEIHEREEHIERRNT